MAISTQKPRMALVAMAAVAALGLIAAGPASADPKPNFTYDLVCGSLGTFAIVNFSNGDPSPGLVLDSHRVILPYAWEATVHATPYVGEPFTRVFSYSRAEPRNGRLDYCTFHYDVYNAVGHGVFDGWALISYTP
jgi:hypothetical protein